MRIAIAIILASLAFHAHAAVPKIVNNFATTNSPSTLSNIVASIGGSGGAQVWTNSAGVIRPVTGSPISNLVFKTSASVTDSNLLELMNNSSNVFRVYPSGSVGIGQGVDFWLGRDMGSFQMVWDTLLGEPINAQFRLGVTDETTGQIWSLGASGTSMSLYADWDGTTIVMLNPTAPDGTTPHYFDTSLAHTSGNLLELANNGTNKFTVAWDGAVTSSGVFTGNGSGLTNLTVASNVATNNGNNQFSSIQTINGAYLRVTNTAAANSYTDHGANGALTNVNPNGGGSIMLSNASSAGTYTLMQSPSNGANVKVLVVVTNSVGKFSVDAVGVVSAGTSTPISARMLTLDSPDTYISYGRANSEKWTTGNESTGGTGDRFVLYGGSTPSYKLMVTAAGAVGIGSTLAATNGIIFYQLQTIPTNTIPVSSASVTNWVLLNLTNTIASGGPMYVATNIAAAGSFLIARPSLTVTTFP